ncbi:MAG: hypothetical protein E7020_05060 [Alphaproteobacteria bacterium]|nr:hypothetical protein [Alphaproteobacteria bacterium]
MLLLIMMLEDDMFRYKNNQDGATMLETLGVLTIVIMLGISSIKLIGNIMAMFKQSMVVSEIQDLQKAITDRYKFEGSYKSLFEGRSDEDIVQYLCENKIAPFQMCSGDRMYHRMGGAVWVVPSGYYEDDVFVADYNKYAMTFYKLTDKTCLLAAQINWNKQKTSSIFKMIINSDKVNKLVVDVPYNMQTGSKTFPADVSDITKACSYDDNNTIEWVFF